MATEKIEKPEETTGVETAVLLILRDDGTCMPVADPKALGIRVKRAATINDIFRMTADVNDQISGVRIFGETSRFLRHLFDSVTSEENLPKLIAKVKAAQGSGGTNE